MPKLRNGWTDGPTVMIKKLRFLKTLSNELSVSRILSVISARQTRYFFREVSVLQKNCHLLNVIYHRRKKQGWRHK